MQLSASGTRAASFQNYEKVKLKACTDIELIALCNIDGDFNESVQTNLKTAVAGDTSFYRTYRGVEELLEKEELDFVITSLPTHLHAKIANLVMAFGNKRKNS